MATITPSSTLQHSMGSLKLYIADFNTASNGDVWQSSITNIVSILDSIRGTPEGSSASGVTWTASSGTVNFQCSAAGNRVTLWVTAGGGWSA